LFFILSPNTTNKYTNSETLSVLLLLFYHNSPSLATRFPRSVFFFRKKLTLAFLCLIDFDRFSFSLQKEKQGLTNARFSAKIPAVKFFS